MFLLKYGITITRTCKVLHNEHNYTHTNIEMHFQEKERKQQNTTCYTIIDLVMETQVKKLKGPLFHS